MIKTFNNLDPCKDVSNKMFMNKSCLLLKGFLHSKKFLTDNIHVSLHTSEEIQFICSAYKLLLKYRFGRTIVPPRYINFFSSLRFDIGPICFGRQFLYCMHLIVHSISCRVNRSVQLDIHFYDIHYIISFQIRESLYSGMINVKSVYPSIVIFCQRDT